MQGFAKCARLCLVCVGLCALITTKHFKDDDACCSHTLMYVHCAPFTLCSRHLLASRLRLRQYNSHCLCCQAILPLLLTTVAYITAHNLTRANDVYMYKLLPSSSSSLHRSQQLKRCNCNFYF